MVILITGASHTGKTLLAQRMLEEFGYPYLSIDHLKMGLIRSGHTDLTPEDDDALTELLWPIVREMVKTAVENRQNLIVEGCYIPFSWRSDFDGRYLPSIRFLCLAMTEAYIDANFDRILAHESEIETRLEPGCSIDALKADNRKYTAGFLAAGEQVTVIESEYLPVIRALLEEIRHSDTEAVVVKAPEDLAAALELVWRVFLEYEAPGYAPEGVREFYRSIHDEAYLSKLRFLGAYRGDRLVGVIATRNGGRHIALFFVDGAYQRQGVGRKLFEAVRTGEMTVNSAPCAVSVYRALGFRETAQEQSFNGVRFVPMALGPIA